MRYRVFFSHSNVGWVERKRNPTEALMGFAYAQPILQIIKCLYLEGFFFTQSTQRFHRVHRGLFVVLGFV